MKESLLNKVSECSRVLTQITDEKELDEYTRLFSDTIAYACHLRHIAYTEGLLALEEEVQKPNDLAGYDYLRAMMTLVISGTNPDEVEEIGTIRIFSENKTGIEALQHIIMLYGVLAVQNGLPTWLTEEKLLCFIPGSYAAKCKKNLDEKKKEKDTEYKGFPEFKEWFLSEGSVITSKDSSYYLAKATDYAIKAMDDRSLETLLTKENDWNLSCAMKGISGDGKKRMINNMSENRAGALLEESWNRKHLFISDVTGAITKLFSTIMTLIDNHEIICPGEDALCFIHRLYSESNEEKQYKPEESVESELYRLLEEYRQGKERFIKNYPTKKKSVTNPPK